MLNFYTLYTSIFTFSILISELVTTTVCLQEIQFWGLEVSFKQISSNTNMTAILLTYCVIILYFWFSGFIICSLCHHHGTNLHLAPFCGQTDVPDNEGIQESLQWRHPFTASHSQHEHMVPWRNGRGVGQHRQCLHHLSGGDVGTHDQEVALQSHLPQILS